MSPNLKQKLRPKALPSLKEKKVAPIRKCVVRPLYLALGLVALFLFIGVTRLPFISNQLVGEETYFGMLVINNGTDNLDDTHHNFLYQARFNGKMYYGPTQHPTPPYLFMTKVMRRFSEVPNFDSLSYVGKSRVVRERFFVCFILALVLILFVAYDALKTADRLSVLLSIGLIAFTLTTPIMVGGSIQPQLDGSIGVLMISVAAFTLYFCTRNRLLVPAALLAGFIAAMGKNEWALTLFAAVAATLIVIGCLRRWFTGVDDPATRRATVLVCCVLVGIVTGSLVSYTIDSWNFVHGLLLMGDFQNKSSSNWWQNLKFRWPFNWPVYPLVLISSLVAFADFKKLFIASVNHALVLLWGLGLFAGFFFSSWIGDHFPRYFCTPIFCLLFFLTAYLPRLTLARWVKSSGLILIVGGILFNISYLIDYHGQKRSLGSSPTTTMSEHMTMLDNSLAKVKAKPGLTTTNLEFGYYYPRWDFISNATPAERAIELHSLYDRQHPVAGGATGSGK